MSNILSLNESNFSAEIASGVILVDFFAPWCRPCHMLSPALDELAQTYRVAKVNVDENQNLSAKYNVSAIPLLIVFKDGREAKRLMGLQSKEVLEEALRVAG